MTPKSITRRRLRSNLIGYLILALGLIISALSIDFQSSITAFIGISLVFWGALLLYVRPTKYVPYSVLNALAGEQMLNDHMSYDEEGYMVKPVYRAKTSLEAIDEIQLILRKNASGEDVHGPLSVIPIGFGLHKLVEKEMKVNFNSVNFNDLKNRLGRCLVETLELSDSVSFNELEDTIKVEITGNVFQDSLEMSIHHEEYRPIGDPLISSIACILARVKNMDVVIEGIELEKNKNRILVQYRSLYTSGVE